MVKKFLRTLKGPPRRLMLGREIFTHILLAVPSRRVGLSVTHRLHIPPGVSNNPTNTFFDLVLTGSSLISTEVRGGVGWGRCLFLPETPEPIKTGCLVGHISRQRRLKKFPSKIH